MPHNSVVIYRKRFSAAFADTWSCNRYVSQPEQFFHGMTEVLFAFEVALLGLHRGMSQQELNLLDLAAAGVAQLRTGSAQVVRPDVLQPVFITRVRCSPVA